MKVDLFDFDLPPEYIALRPAECRDRARLLVVRGQERENRVVTDLADYVERGDVLVFNDTRVIPARLIGRRRQAKIDVTLHMDEGDGRWRAFVRPAKKLKITDIIVFSDRLNATVMDKRDGGEVSVQFNCAGEDFKAALAACGVMPLPPYIAARRPVDARDLTDYQTIYATKEGAVAAPTAGLHFTAELLKKLSAKGVVFVDVTLHVGAGTFLPVKVADSRDHKMHSEWGEIGLQAAEAINAAHDRGGRVIAVGTTSLRLLESAVDDTGKVQPFSGTTDIFITPGYKFRSADILMTNFHLPRSTLFMLVSAFGGYDAMTAAYDHAIKQHYRFYSYGDSSLLFREDEL
ncbi:MAG: tRNA preQ1(34) S-adenosylmethionine ribosyltransferase-isomerase QueA [Alphaproteobacteria bacterium]|nr:tRNA preQ1(34) S-adenosylmethionine ribosyltransferase-isomerase QueA [Alphaproteobacteria bacterium]